MTPVQVPPVCSRRSKQTSSARSRSAHPGGPAGGRYYDADPFNGGAQTKLQPPMAAFDRSPRAFQNFADVAGPQSSERVPLELRCSKTLLVLSPQT